MKIIIIYGVVLLLFYWKRFNLLLVWVVASPYISNLIRIPQDNPFFGCYRIVDYIGYSFGPAKHLVEWLDFDRIVLLLFFLAALKNYRRPEDVSVIRVQRWLAVFTVGVFISALYSHNVLNALRKATDTFGLCYLAFRIGSAYLADSRAWKQFLMAIVFLGAVLGCNCFIEYRMFGEWSLEVFEDVYRVCGPFQFWETLGMTVSIVAFVAWFFYITASGSGLQWKKAAYAGLCLLMVYCVFRTQTRTIMLAITLGIVLLLYNASGVIIKKAAIRKFVLSLSILGVVCLVLPDLLTNTRFFQSTLSRHQTEDARKEAYTAASRMFIQNPLVGIGLKNFQEDMKNYMRAGEVQFSSPGTTSCHSSYFVVAAECGLMGLVPLFFLILYAFVMCKRYASKSLLLTDKAWAVAILGMTLTYFYCGTTFDPFFDPTMQNQLYYMCLGGTAARLEELNRPDAIN